MDAQLIAGATNIVGDSQEEYHGLPIRFEVIDCGHPLGHQPAMRSEWRPTKAELDALNAGGSVYLTILGNQHPPVMVEVGEATSEDYRLTF